jgi:hypothetical protein
VDLATAGPSDFEALVDSIFRSATADGERVDLTLIAIERGPDDPHARPFRLLFRGSSTRLPQGIVSLHGDGVPTLDLFLVPAIPDAEGPLYVAVFG